MSDKSDQMRPIPDGGLKDGMPSWLKRPPAWRDMPTAEQRHERALPDADTSEIDPHALVDVTDLPQWLQSIAARGRISAPAADASVDHAVDVVHIAHEPIANHAATDESTSTTVGNVPGDSSDWREVAELVPGHRLESDPEVSLATTPVSPAASRVPVWAWPMAALVLIVLVLTLYILT